MGRKTLSIVFMDENATDVLLTCWFNNNFGLEVYSTNKNVEITMDGKNASSIIWIGYIAIVVVFLILYLLYKSPVLLFYLLL